jgi:hypothetical protein
LSSGEAAFVSTWTLWSAEDSLEEMLAPGHITENRYAFALRDRVDLCDKDFRSCLARVCGFTLKGSPILRPYEAGPFLVAADLSLPETLPAEAGTVRRKAA